MRKFDYKSESSLDILKYIRLYRVYNFKTSIVEQVIHVRFNDHKFAKKLLKLDDYFVDLNLQE